MGLVEKLAQVATGLVGELPVSIVVEVRGEIAEYDCSVLSISALRGSLMGCGAEDVTYVNAPALSNERGLSATVITDPISPDHRNMVSVRAAFSDGTQLVVSGTLMGIRQVQKIVAIDSHDLDLLLTENLLFLRYADKPGIVGAVGNALGKAGINIGGMQVGRNHQGGEALMAITVDSLIPTEILNSVQTETGATTVRAVVLAN